MRDPSEWNLIEWVARWLVFAAIFIIAVPFEIAAAFFFVVAAMIGLLAAALHGIVDWMATHMLRVIGIEDKF
jgi:hypothetical protein